MGGFYAYLMRHPKRFLALLLLITAALAVPAARIRIDSSVEGLIMEEDPDRVFFDRVKEIFGNDEILVVRWWTRRRYSTPRAFKR